MVADCEVMLYNMPIQHRSRPISEPFFLCIMCSAQSVRQPDLLESYTPLIEAVVQIDWRIMVFQNIANFDNSQSDTVVFTVCIAQEAIMTPSVSQRPNSKATSPSNVRYELLLGCRPLRYSTSTRYCTSCQDTDATISFRVQHQRVEARIRG